MKRNSTLFMALFILLSGALSAQQVKPQYLNAAQVSKLDFTGKWTGKRKQYAPDKKSFIEVFEYEFDLKQEGNIITGTTTIISSNGEYADMKLEGVVIGNKLHFAEKEIKAAARPEGKVWCFKSGELNIVKEGDNLKLVGATPSFMEVYNYPCSGGETDLVKVDNSNNLSAVISMNGTASANEEQFSISAFPNPFIDNVGIYYNLNTDAKVKAEVYDISGKLVTTLFDGNQKTGNYNLTFTPKNFGSMSGIFIVKLAVNGDVFSRQIVQMR